MKPLPEFLRTHRWRARSALLVWSGIATLAALAQTGLARLGWWASPVESTLLPIGLAALLLGAWFLRARRLTPQRLASELDSRWTLRARLESAVELAGTESAWGAAQRADARQAIAGRQPPGTIAWRVGQLALFVLTSLLLVEGAALAVRSSHATLTASPTATATTKPGSPPVDEIRAAIEWKSPKTEIGATAIEEVPLVALADSGTGFRSFSLEMTVNGEREVSRTLDPATPGEAEKPGPHEVGASLFLDELQVKPFDLVSYRLVGELNTPGAKRVVASPPQFVKIRPPQVDASLSGRCPAEFPAMLRELEVGQLNLIKQNATLARLSAGASGDPSWAPENARVAAEQDKLAGRTAEVLAWTNGKTVPPLVTQNLGNVEARMKSASRDIAAKANEAAAKPQSRALALLLELEKFLNKTLSNPNAKPAPDPFPDEQAFEPPARSGTPAGELEALVERQKKANAELAGGSPGAGAGEGADPADLANGQTAIAGDATRLATSNDYAPEVKNAVAEAGTAATEAARQLGLNDRAAARVPAAASLRALEQALAAQEKAGRAASVAELETVRRSLNAASRAGAAERTERLTAARTTLRSAAVQQQRTGSAEAARELAQLAKLIGTPARESPRGGNTALTAPNSPERAREVAGAAAHAQVLLSARTAAVSRVVRLLTRASGSLVAGNLATGEVLGDLEIASQEAQWIASDPATVELAQQLGAQTNAAQSPGAGGPATARDLAGAAVKLATALEHGRAASERDMAVRRFNPADVDPEYREAVETYFERLSRDGRRAAPAAAKQ